MAILTPYILCALFLAALYGLMRLALFFSNRAAYQSVLKSGIFSPKAIHTLLLSVYGARQLLSGVYLPSETAEHGFERLDHILFLDGAVVILSLHREGELLNGARKKEALHTVFRAAGYKKRLPVEHIAILPTRKKGTPRPDTSDLLSAPEAMKKLRAFQKPFRFDKKRKKQLKKCVASARLSLQEIRTRKATKRRRKS